MGEGNEQLATPERPRPSSLREFVSGGPLEGAVILGMAGLRAAEAMFVHRGDLVDNVLHVRGSS